MSSYRAVLDVIERIQNAMIVAFFVLTIVIVSFQVLNRFWFHWPVVWTSDAAVLCFIWLSFLTASVAVRKYGHFRVGVLIDLPWRRHGRRNLELLSLVLIILLSLVLVIEGTRVALEGLREISPGIQISMIWAYASVPVCSLTAILFAVEKTIEQLSSAAPSSEAPMEEEN
ncbi:MAG TPA: TRAP transporter small permease subunit [Alphaproteobacteria bacterium]